MQAAHDAGYGSHVPMLARALATSEGPVLELGAGWTSTPLIDEVCSAQRRTVLTVETKPDWIKLFVPVFSSEWHTFLLVEETDAGLWKVPIEQRQWGVAFVDHAPGTRRVVDIERLRKHAGLIVIHDTEEKGYGYEPLLSSFKFRVDYKALHPWTTIVSDLRPI